MLSSLLGRRMSYLWVPVAGLFGYSALAKLLGSGFRDYLAGTYMYPRPLVPIVATLVIATELFTAALLCWRRWRTLGWLAAGALGAGFAAYHGVLLALGDTGVCYCAGVPITHDGFLNHIIVGGICLIVFCLACVGVLNTQRAASAPRRYAASALSQE